MTLYLSRVEVIQNPVNPAPTNYFSSIPGLAVEDHGEAQRLQALLSTKSVEEPNTSTILLPIALFKQKAHGGTTSVAVQNGLKRFRASLVREDGCSNELVSGRRIVPRAHSIWIRSDAPDIGLKGRANCDLVGVLEGRIGDFEHAARCTSGDEVEGHDTDELIARGACGASEVEDLAIVGMIRVASLEDVDD